MGYDQKEIAAIISRVKARLDGVPVAPVAVSGAAVGSEGIHDTVDQAVEAAWQAQKVFVASGLELRKRMIESVRASMRSHAEETARMAHEETGLGRYEDKLVKTLLVTNKTPGPEELEPTMVTGDDGMMAIEYAPFGVIAAITPTTNPTSTIINNSIAAVSAGNSIVFNVHPSAKRVSVYCVRLINRAIVAAGGPVDLVTCVPEPTIASAQALMNHPKARIILVTGGPGVVKAALATNKRAITAGPGNPPVVVDATADIDNAARSIIKGASFDNNVICVDEKETLVVAEVHDQLLKAMAKAGARVLKQFEVAKLERTIFKELGAPRKPGKINPKMIGKNAAVIAKAAGIEVSGDPRLLIAPVPVEHSLVWTEQMMPVMPVSKVADIDEAITTAVAAEHGFGHSAAIYSRDIDAITRMGRAMNCSIFVVNGPIYSGLGAGGEGFTSFSIASPTGEGLTRPRTFSRERRLTIVGSLRIV